MKLRAERARITALALAPLALVLAAWLLPRVDPNARLGFLYDRDGFLELARRQVEVAGRPVDGWGERIKVEKDDSLDRFLRLRRQEFPSAVRTVRRIAPPVRLEVRFISLGADPDARILLAPDGAFLGATLEPMESKSELASALPAQERAEAFLREWLGEELAALAEPVEGKSPEDPLSDTVRWSLVLPELPELTITPEVTVQEGRITGWEASSSLEAAAVGAGVERGGGSIALRIVAGVLLLLVAAAMLPRGLWRYWLRFQESEVSHARTVLLGLLVAGLAAASLIFLLLSETARMNDGLLAGPVSIALAGLVVAAMMLPLGLLLGAAWAGTEGDVREIFPAKLVSLDALLAGRWLSRNPARALLHGAASACWVCLAHTLVLALWALRPEAGPDLVPFTFLVRHPWHFTIAVSLLLLIPYGSLGFLGLLSLLRRWTRSRWRTVLPVTVVLWLACLLLPWVTKQIPMTAGLLLAAVWAAAFLIPFYAFDVLTAFLCFVQASLFLEVLLFLSQPAPALVASAALPMAILGVCLVGAALALRFGRDVDPREVRPGYARNMLERASLSAELSAALQARTKLLPQLAPDLPGASFTLSTVPDEEAEGEYYDFFPLDDGRVAFALADFGHQGLAAALRMTLAKGHLMSYSRRELAPGEAVARLERRLDELVTDPGEIALVYGIHDPASGRLRLAGGSGAPWVLLRDRTGELKELPSEEPVREGVADEPWEETLVLEAGDAAAFLALSDEPSSEGRQRFLRALTGRKDDFTAKVLRQLLRDKGLPSGTVMVLRVPGEQS